MKIALLISLLTCNVLIAQENNKSLQTLFEQYQEDLYRMVPVAATVNGDNRYNDQLPITFTDSYKEKFIAFIKKYYTALTAFKKQDLNDNDKLSYDIMKWQMDDQLAGAKFKDNRMPISQFRGLHIQLPQMGSGTGIQPFKTVKDYENWLSRARTFSTWADSIILYFRKGIAEGIVLPSVIVNKLIPQLESFKPGDTTSTFYGPIRNFPKDFSEADKKRFTESFATLINQDIIPSYQKLAKFVKEEYLPAARSTSGWTHLPNGKDWYAYNVKNITTTTKTPDEIFNIGLAEVKRIRGEMEKVKESVQYKGTLNEFLEYLRTDPKFFPHKTAEEILAAYRDIEPRIAATLKRMFLYTPATSFEIRQTEAFRAASAAAQYQSGLPDGSRPGIFYVPIVDPTKVKVSEALFIHEAIPGHHYQIMLQKENKNLPDFRRNGGFTSYAEGWGLYAESLGKELGIYTDPYQYMQALNSEIHRANRLVVDPGLHAKGWTREQAIKYMLDNSSMSEQAAVAEVERYMVLPGQAVAYKIGALKIIELRDRYSKMLGKKFDLAQFHNQVLKDGAMPLELLEQKLERYYKSL